MKRNSCLVSGLIIGVPALVLAGVGAAIAYFAFLDYDIPWTRLSIQSPPSPAVDILRVDFRWNLTDPTGDTLYVTAEDGRPYSTVLFDNHWTVVQTLPDWESDHATECAPAWPGAPSDAEIWDPPPVPADVIDSVGTRFEHSLATDVRCYVLSPDGSLEVWTREDNFLPIAAFFQAALILVPCGGILGIVVGILILRFRDRRSAAA